MHWYQRKLLISRANRVFDALRRPDLTERSGEARQTARSGVVVKHGMVHGPNQSLHMLDEQGAYTQGAYILSSSTFQTCMTSVFRRSRCMCDVAVETDVDPVCLCADQTYRLDGHFRYGT